MLRCPRCTFTLAPTVRGDSEVDFCPRCHGAWFETGELKRVLGEKAEPLFWKKTRASTHLGMSALDCPHGHGVLGAYRVMAPDETGLPVEVDVCPVCLGVWLDAWEAVRLMQATKHLLREPDYVPPAERKEGAGWYLFQLFSGLPVEEYNPLRRKPVVVLLLMLGSLVGFALTMMREDPTQFLLTYGLVPAEVEAGRHLYSVITHMFLHASPLHLFTNLWFLYTFGDNVEDRVGRVRFLVLYLAFGVVAAAAQFVAVRGATIPLVGASGAIAGLLGAYMMMFPRARLFVVVLFIRFKLSVAAYFTLWVVMQAGLAFFSMWQGQSAGVAFWAHLGGFVSGSTWGWLNRDRFGDGAELRRAGLHRHA